MGHGEPPASAGAGSATGRTATVGRLSRMIARVHTHRPRGRRGRRTSTRPSRSTARAFGMALVHEETNEEQGVREAMMAVGDSGSCVQLLAPLRPDSTIGKFLDRTGPGIQQVAYTVDGRRRGQRRAARARAAAALRRRRGAAPPAAGSTSSTRRTPAACWSSSSSRRAGTDRGRPRRGAGRRLAAASRPGRQRHLRRPCRHLVGSRRVPAPAALGDGPGAGAVPARRPVGRRRCSRATGCSTSAAAAACWPRTWPPTATGSPASTRRSVRWPPPGPTPQRVG